MGSDAGDARQAARVRPNGEAAPPYVEPPQAGIYGYLLTDAVGIIREANDAAAVLLQARREFLLGKPLGLFVTESYRPAFYERLARQRSYHHSMVFETRLGRAPRGSIAVIITLSPPIWDGEGAACFRWLLRDISDTLRIEQLLRSERQLLDSVIDAAQAIILVLDSGGRILRSNTYASTVTGWDPHELYGRVWYETLLYPEDRREMFRMVAEARTFGVAQSGVVPLLTRTGARRELILSARGLPEGVAGSTVLVGHDVTELQEAQRQALAKERLAAIGQMAAGIAHEGRNALQRIQACLSIITLRCQGEPAILDLLERAQKAQDDLEHLFSDIRSYSATLEPHPVIADMADAWREAWANVVALNSSAQAQLREDLAGTDTTCEFDPFQLCRVFRNLFENSLVACPVPVCVTVRCRPTSQEKAPGLVISVRDNGPGFPPEHVRRLFEPFFTTKTHGTGLGLAICRRVIEAHGGRIEAGEPGPGAEIRIILPRRMP